MLADPLSLSGAPFLVQKEGTQVLRMRKSLMMRRRSLSRREEMFGWFKPERRERRRKVRQDRKHLEERARRFLKRYLEADDTRKPQFYRAVEEISRHSRALPERILEQWWWQEGSRPLIVRDSWEISKNAPLP